MSKIELIQGDCIEKMKEIPDKSSDRMKQEIDNEQICSSFNRLLMIL